MDFVAFFFLSSNSVLYNLSSPIKDCDWPALPAMAGESNPGSKDHEYPSLKQKPASTSSISSIWEVTKKKKKKKKI